MQIGVCIREAIDWVQDRLTTTRPLAERTLFNLMTKRHVIETDLGFVLTEVDHDDTIKQTHNHLRVRGPRLRTAQRMRQHPERIAKDAAKRHAARTIDDALP